MAISYLTKTDLDRYLQQNGHYIEPSVRSALIDSLEHSGVYSDHPGDASKAAFQSESFSGGRVPAGIQILEVAESTKLETTPNLKAIVVVGAGGTTLDVIGGRNNVAIAMGERSDAVNLFDYGDDTINGGRGNDVMAGGHGNSLLSGGAGNDSVRGGSGNDTLNGGTGKDYLKAGTGAQLLDGGSDDDTLEDLSSGHSTLLGGDGNDKLTGLQGDVLDGGEGNDHLWLLGGSGANSTLYGGNGDDTFHLLTGVGNTTIIGGAGLDTVDFTGRSSHDAKIDFDDKTSSYTVFFEDTKQTVVVSGVEDFHFSDQVVHLPKP